MRRIELWLLHARAWFLARRARLLSELEFELAFELELRRSQIATVGREQRAVRSRIGELTPARAALRVIERTKRFNQGRGL